MSKPVIICVDDEPTVLESLKIELKRVLGDSCLIETAEGGEEALSLIEELQQDEYEVALVLADYIMPDIKGDELLRQIHDLSPHTLNIMISGQADLAAVGNAIRNARLYRYIAKPWQPDDLQATVIEAIQSYLQDRKLESQNAKLQQTNLELEQAIATQTKLYQQVQQFNQELENQVQERTVQLRQLLEFESLLKRITDKVRDSLDENQILQTAVQELAVELNLICCDAALYDLENRTSTICYEYLRVDEGSAQGAVISLDQKADIYQQLLQGKSAQFCLISLQPDPCRNLKDLSSILVCPLMNERGVFGDLWLFKQRSDGFTDLEIRLVQQIANQCAIALRQSRLYQLLQMQVKNLEHLSQVKDDFLSSVSHELRSPMVNIKMAIQMLETVLKPLGIGEQTSGQATRYFQILRDECQRETNLINDLLDMARLEAGVDLIRPTAIDLRMWLPYLVEPFVERTRQQQQDFHLDIPNELPSLTTDATYLERILSELLHNACKYTPIAERIVMSVVFADAQFWFRISNSGIEIPMEGRERIFEKFYRIPKHDQRRQGGTGLGLALVKKQIEQLRGTIAVSGEAGWTTFTVQLPNLAPDTTGYEFMPQGESLR